MDVAHNTPVIEKDKINQHRGAFQGVKAVTSLGANDWSSNRWMDGTCEGGWPRGVSAPKRKQKASEQEEETLSRAGNTTNFRWHFTSMADNRPTVRQSAGMSAPPSRNQPALIPSGPKKNRAFFYFPLENNVYFSLFFWQMSLPVANRRPLWPGPDCDS